jgi:hypothetical protein
VNAASLRSRPRTNRMVGLAVIAGLAALTFGALAVPSTSSGYIATVKNSTDTAATAVNFTCAGALAVDQASALFSYRLNEASGATSATDYASGSRPGTYVGTMTSTTAPAPACPRDAGGAYVLNGSTSYVSMSQSQVNPTTFSLEVWFKTTVAGGKLIGFGNVATGVSSIYDRHLYLTTAGKVAFGTYNGVNQIVTSPTSYNDGAWHQAVATFSAGTGMILYVDGAKVASNAAFVTAQNFTGYWRIGYDNLNGWGSTAPPYFFSGSMRFAAVYTTVLTQPQVTNHYVAGR